VNIIVNVTATLAAIGLTIAVCWAIDGILRLVKPPPPARHRLADHPQGYRDWVGKPRPVGLSVQATATAIRRRREEMERLRVDAVSRLVRVWQDGGPR
jgi:hypothetical protein